LFVCKREWVRSETRYNDERRVEEMR
jgi:hypothetical protein